MKCAVSACLVGYGTGAYDPWAPAADNFSYCPYRYNENGYFPQVLYFTVVETGLTS